MLFVISLYRRELWLRNLDVMMSLNVVRCPVTFMLDVLVHNFAILFEKVMRLLLNDQNMSSATNRPSCDNYCVSYRVCRSAFTLLRVRIRCFSDVINPLMGTLKSQSNGPFNSNTAYTGRWFWCCYIWYREEGPMLAAPCPVHSSLYQM